MYSGFFALPRSVAAAAAPATCGPPAPAGQTLASISIARHQHGYVATADCSLCAATEGCVGQQCTASSKAQVTVFQPRTGQCLSHAAALYLTCKHAGSALLRPHGLCWRRCKALICAWAIATTSLAGLRTSLQGIATRYICELPNHNAKTRPSLGACKRHAMSTRPTCSVRASMVLSRRSALTRALTYSPREASVDCTRPFSKRRITPSASPLALRSRRCCACSVVWRLSSGGDLTRPRRMRHCAACTPGRVDRWAPPGAQN